ncbi:hypothetical protein FWK35_00022676 [Aphis craccivora]|uniref:Uncharacterized protein n=2 Tax=Aphis craccivora TaxID=307492 RepID=A0A6G0YMM3_APHCR|nr:hypothetical protein FWK35_00020213 [Aphis craccivora]KAF0756518.1 hypothetical protein FWK35_00028215 [Aphis craccivora]KAF0758758.1 hypothetical protein FWK35_00024301 [Aphis craccivora]KAF0764723.1 hypothetical protein FWK35_00022676 [Aphis craccivora]
MVVIQKLITVNS